MESRSSQSSAEGCDINIKHNKYLVEGTSNRAEPSSFSLNGGHLLPRWRLWRPSIGKGDESYKWEWGRHRLVNLFVKIVSKRSKWKLFMQFWQSVAIMFSPWKGPVWAESTRKICFRIFINKGWKRTLGSWSYVFFDRDKIWVLPSRFPCSVLLAFVMEHNKWKSNYRQVE